MLTSRAYTSDFDIVSLSLIKFYLLKAVLVALHACRSSVVKMLTSNPFESDQDVEI